MNYFDEKRKILSLNNYKDKQEIERESYQRFLRKQYTSENIKKYVDMKHLEEIFSNKIYYNAMRNISSLEKQVLYLYFYDCKTLKEICFLMKKSKKEVIKLKNIALKHFKKNIIKYKKLYSKKSGCDNNV